MLRSRAPGTVKRIMTQPIVRGPLGCTAALHSACPEACCRHRDTAESTECRCMAPQNLIFRFLQSRQKVQIWLFEQTDLRVEGRIIVRLPPPR